MRFLPALLTMAMALKLPMSTLQTGNRGVPKSVKRESPSQLGASIGSSDLSDLMDSIDPIDPTQSESPTSDGFWPAVIGTIIGGSYGGYKAHTFVSSQCHLIKSADECLQLKLGVHHECFWCALDQSCQTIDIEHTCPAECCASANILFHTDYCQHRDAREIDRHEDYLCVQPSRRFNTTAYDADVSRRLAHVAAAAYCAGETLRRWVCHDCKSVEDFTFVDALHSELGIQAIIGFDHRLKKTVLVFSSPFLKNSFYSEANRPNHRGVNPFQNYPKAGVFAPFAEDYSSIHMKLMTALNDLELPTPDYADLVVAGHSVGGAVAQLCAFDLSVNHGRNIASVYTFGAPRTGDFRFRHLYNRIVPNSWRLTVRGDAISHLPSREAGYYHTGYQICYQKGDGKDDTYAMRDPGEEDAAASDLKFHSRQTVVSTYYMNGNNDKKMFMGVPIGDREQTRCPQEL